MVKVPAAAAVFWLLLFHVMPLSAAQRESSRYVAVDGMAIHYYEAGDPSGLPIVFSVMRTPVTEPLS